MKEDTKKASRSKKVASLVSIDKTEEQNKGRTLKIDISKYKSLDNILGDRERISRVFITILLIGIALFVSITFIAICLKRYYSYSDITTNGLGATTFKSEKSEVSYWLYNSSQLWANSGITVHAGDIISVRSSGKFITAIHHVYDNVTKNESFKDDWVGSEGERDNEDVTSSSFLRRKFRMFPNLPTGALVMQVVENEHFDYDREAKANPENFYFIGKGREDIYIKNPGTLYFSLNDIVLNRITIIDMVYKCLERDLNKDFLELRRLYGFPESFRKEVDSIKGSLQGTPNHYYSHPDDLFLLYNRLYGALIANMNRGDRKLGDVKIGVSYIRLKDIKDKLGSAFCFDTTKVRDALVVYNENNKTFSLASSYQEGEIKKRYPSGYRIVHLTELRNLPELLNSIEDKLRVILQDDSCVQKIFKEDNDFKNKVLSYEIKDIGLLEKRLNKEYQTAHIVTEKTICSEKYKKYYRTTVPNNVKISDIDKNQTEIIQIDTIIKMCELEYYYKRDYKTAWFDDNLGSFLIVIEKDTSK